jgi:crossover junction endodeoxyribonuclease RusA
MQMIFTLPWPPKELSPNSRQHHMALARVKKRFRSACALTALSQGAHRLQAEKLEVNLVFFPPDKRGRDVDNCVASLKAGLDGLADVLGVDDRRWKWGKPPALADQIGGFVKVEVIADGQDSHSSHSPRGGAPAFGPDK